MFKILNLTFLALLIIGCQTTYSSSNSFLGNSKTIEPSTPVAPTISNKTPPTKINDTQSVYYFHQPHTYTKIAIEELPTKQSPAVARLMTENLISCLYEWDYSILAFYAYHSYIPKKSFIQYNFDKIKTRDKSLIIQYKKAIRQSANYIYSTDLEIHLYHAVYGSIRNRFNNCFQKKEALYTQDIQSTLNMLEIAAFAHIDATNNINKSDHLLHSQKHKKLSEDELKIIDDMYLDPNNFYDLQKESWNAVIKNYQSTLKTSYLKSITSDKGIIISDLSLKRVLLVWGFLSRQEKIDFIYNLESNKDTMAFAVALLDLEGNQQGVNSRLLRHLGDNMIAFPANRDIFLEYIKNNPGYPYIDIAEYYFTEEELAPYLEEGND